MEKSYLVRALGECLEVLEQDETDINALANRYPDLEEELKPLLELAQKLRGESTHPEPSPSFLMELQRQLLAS